MDNEREIHGVGEALERLASCSDFVLVTFHEDELTEGTTEVRSYMSAKVLLPYVIDYLKDIYKHHRTEGE